VVKEARFSAGFLFGSSLEQGASQPVEGAWCLKTVTLTREETRKSPFVKTIVTDQAVSSSWEVPEASNDHGFADDE
jgi:hypothetical protein